MPILDLLSCTQCVQGVSITMVVSGVSQGGHDGVSMITGDGYCRSKSDIAGIFDPEVYSLSDSSLAITFATFF